MGSRYMSWMALGGTQRQIPAAVLDLVARADVLGINRHGFFVSGSANMLAVAEGSALQLADSGRGIRFRKRDARRPATDPLERRRGALDRALRA